MGPPAPFVEIDGLANFRDLGGLPTASGTTRPHRLFRSDALNLVSETGHAQLERLGCATVFDLRSTEELVESPGPWPVRHLPLHEEFEDLDLPAATSLSGRDAGVAWLQSFYELMLVDAAPRFASVFETLADADNLPAIVHCAGGKDRTGITVALVLSALEVPRDVVLDDFALKAPFDAAIAERVAGVHDRFVALGIESDVADGLLSAPRESMEGALLYLDDELGGINRYLSVVCGISQATVEALRDNLVE